MLTFDPLTTFNAFDAVKAWLLVMAVLGTAGLMVFLASTLATYGFSQGPNIFLRQLNSFFGDWTHTSLKRIGAVASLTWKEATRRKALYVFAIFAVLYLFAGWFTKGVAADADMALKVYVGFVLRTILWLSLPVVLILSCWGLPEDIRLRSVHTVVTKPIRRHEIVLGRIAGYCAVGLTTVTLMSIVGYLWIVRQLPPAARVQLEAKVPIYGTIAFRDREGAITTQGINVGDENLFRSFIDGNTKARAIWDFYNPAWEQWRDRDELTVGGVIEPGDQFVVTIDKEKLIVRATSPDPQVLASEIAAVWSRAEPLKQSAFMKITAVPSGNTVQLTPKSPDANMALETAVIPVNKEGPVRAEFHSAGIRLEADFQAFRTWKGNIDKGLLCQFLISKEYGVLTIPPKVAKGTLRMGKTLEFEVKVPEGDARSTSDAIIAALAKADPRTHPDFRKIVPELKVPADRSQGEGATLILRAPPNDTLPALKVSGVPGLKYQWVRVDGSTSPFEIREFRRNEYLLPRAVIDRSGKAIDLYRDLIDGGRLRVETRCLSTGQLLGMARPDLMVRLPSRTFLETYFKACLTMALLVCVVAVIGVCASTFVKGPIALFLTAKFLFLGLVVRQFLDFLAAGKNTGGGALEGAYRIVNHMNPNVEADKTQVMDIVKILDTPFVAGAWSLSRLIPDFRLFVLDEYVAKAFDAPWQSAVLPCVLISLGVAVPWIVLAHFSMMLRELEHK